VAGEHVGPMGGCGGGGGYRMDQPETDSHQNTAATAILQHAAASAAPAVLTHIYM